MLKVLVVHNDGIGDLPSGEVSVIRQEENMLTSLGVDVCVHIHKPKLESNGRLGDLINKLKLVINMIWSSSMYRVVAEEIDEYKPDVIHFHSIMPYLSLSVLVAAKRKKIPVVQTLHNMRWLCVEGGFYRKGAYCDDCSKNSGMKGALRGCSRGALVSALIFFVNHFARRRGRLFNWVDQFIAVSGFVKNTYVAAGFPESKITVKNNAIELPENVICSNSVDRCGIAFAGRISTAKGSNVIRHLIPYVEERINIIGVGPELDELKAFCEDNSYKHVHFWGHQTRSRTLEILSTAKCTIVPSQCGETFSLVAAESMALSTPVVASDLGGVSDLVRSAGGGVVIGAEDNQGFLLAINQLLQDSAKAAAYGQEGRIYVKNHLSSESNGEQLMKIYQDVIRKRKKL